MWLRIFDFDGTLFRSPSVPQEEWDSSLDPPVVPEVPGIDWWIRATLVALSESVEDPYIYTIVATGRQQDIFTDRVYELLDQIGMLEGIDEVHLTPEGRMSHEYKMELFEKILEVIAPELDGVEFWDDHDDYLPDYVDLAEKFGLAAYAHLVSVPKKKPWYESIASKYLGME